MKVEVYLVGWIFGLFCGGVWCYWLVFWVLYIVVLYWFSWCWMCFLCFEWDSVLVIVWLLVFVELCFVIWLVCEVFVGCWLLVGWMCWVFVLCCWVECCWWVVFYFVGWVWVVGVVLLFGWDMLCLGWVVLFGFDGGRLLIGLVCVGWFWVWGMFWFVGWIWFVVWFFVWFICFWLLIIWVCLVLLDCVVVVLDWLVGGSCFCGWLGGYIVWVGCRVSCWDMVVGWIVVYWRLLFVGFCWVCFWFFVNGLRWLRKYGV